MATNAFLSYVHALFGAIGRTKFQGKKKSNKVDLVHGFFIYEKVGNHFSFV
jgi:hypothetical protein